MTHDYLIEIGLEDMPAHVVTPSLNQFHEKTVTFLKANHLEHGRIDRYATPGGSRYWFMIWLLNKQMLKKMSKARLRKLPKMQMATGRRLRSVFHAVRA